jgi:hypothetical protein
MTIELLASKKLSDMTDNELNELRHSISEIQIERDKKRIEIISKLTLGDAG